VQNLELWALLALAVATVVGIATRLARHAPLSRAAVAAGLGIAAGGLGAIVVLVLRLDLVPDDYEGIVLPGLAILVTAALLAAAWRRLRDA
jgi:hypothetical protein